MKRKNKILIVIGFIIYFLIATFVYMDILRVYMVFVDNNLIHAIGLAIGMDALVVFLNCISVLRPRVMFSFFANTTTFFVWFIVFSSLSHLYISYELNPDIKTLLAFVLSLVPMFTAFLGKTLGYLIKEDEENNKKTPDAITTEALEAIKSSDRTILMPKTTYENAINDKRRKYIYENFTKEDILNTLDAGDNILISFKKK